MNNLCFKLYQSITNVFLPIMPLGLSYLFYLTFIYSCANGQKSKLYFRHTNKQLGSASVVHSEQRTDPEKCLQVCFRHEWCKSFNSFKMVAGDVEYTCDFFNVDTCTTGSPLNGRRIYPFNKGLRIYGGGVPLPF